MKAHIQESDSGLVLHPRKGQNPLRVPSVIADEFMRDLEDFLLEDPPHSVRRVLRHEWMTPSRRVKNEETTAWKMPKKAFGYPKAMLAKTVPLALDDDGSDITTQIKLCVDEADRQLWRAFASIRVNREQLNNLLIELNEYRRIGSVDHVRLLHNRFGKEVERMECSRPSWSDRENDFCPCDNPEYGKNPGENKNPCEDCTHYTDKDE